MNIENEKKLLELFRLLFDFQTIPDPDELRQTHLRTWDSMMIANLVVAVENEFEISVSNEEYEEFTSFSQIAAILDEKCL